MFIKLPVKRDKYNLGYIQIKDKDEMVICSVKIPFLHREKLHVEENVKYIIKAINTYDGCIETLKLSEQFIKELAPKSKLLKIINEAIKKGQ